MQQMQITNISRKMNTLDINVTSILASYLKLHEINKLGVISKHVHYNCRNFMTYVYNEYGYNESYYRLHMAKWIVYKCNELFLQECKMYWYIIGIYYL